MRARTPHYEMCRVFKREHEAKFGGFYGITSLDAKEAHELFVLNGELTEEQIVPYCRNYFVNDFPGWSERAWPAWLFWKHFNSFAPKVEKKVTHKSTRWCPECQTAHSINEPCPEKRDIQSVIGQIGRKIA